jgi:exodeoxyribonuclease V alpha subunit
MQQTRAAPATLDAVLERITYANQETGYTVARVATDRSGDLLTVVGPLLGAQPGESLRLRGRWASHPQYGRQFQVEAYDTVLPATIQGIRRYLGSGLIKGIGPKMAERIVDHFGPATLEVIEQEPGRLVEVPGLGPKRTRMITAAWEEQQAIKEVMVFQDHRKDRCHMSVEPEGREQTPGAIAVAKGGQPSRPSGGRRVVGVTINDGVRGA